MHYIPCLYTYIQDAVIAFQPLVWAETSFLEDLLQQGMRSNPVAFFKRHLYKTFEEKSSANVTGTSVLARDHLLQIFRSIFPANCLPSSGINNYIPPMGSRKNSSSQLPNWMGVMFLVPIGFQPRWCFQLSTRVTSISSPSRDPPRWPWHFFRLKKPVRPRRTEWVGQTCVVNTKTHLSAIAPLRRKGGWIAASCEEVILLMDKTLHQLI